MANQTKLHYYCSNCKNILHEAESEIGLSHVVEPCPFCGSLLSESLQKRRMMPKIEHSAIFQPASKVPRLTVDIKKIDSVMPCLSLNQKIAIVGHNSQKLIERLAVRAQLPHRHGGLGSYVILVDGGNSSDPYLGINFARQYGLDVQDVLSKIISSRAFTVYQLESLVTHELPNIIKKYNAKFIAISDLLAMFTDDPYLDKHDAERLLDSILQSISKLKECLVVVSITKPTGHDTIMRSFDRIIQLSNKDDIITVNLDSNGSLAIKSSELEIISRK